MRSVFILLHCALLLACQPASENQPANQAAATDHEILNTEAKQNSENPPALVPAKKPSTDASHHAIAAWQLMQQVEAKILQAEITTFDQDVFTPIRKLQNRWRTEVRMSDSVIESRLALCRKALISLDSWARTVQQSNNQSYQSQKQQQYLLHKKQCQSAIENLELKPVTES